VRGRRRLQDGATILDLHDGMLQDESATGAAGCKDGSACNSGQLADVAAGSEAGDGGGGRVGDHGVRGGSCGEGGRGATVQPPLLRAVLHTFLCADGGPAAPADEN
jgi:hypothetical protein